MRIATRVAGAAGLAAFGMVSLGATAFADSTGNEGVNLGNGNNVSAAPIQACGTNAAVLGAVVPVLSPQPSHCVNAPLTDHPSAEG
ncbi:MULTISPECIES: hypothetical protein [unclassified Saccharopolyspora]|uniref:hypothetical protein n=1 Tax=unclassified Saccharopolyspora TaxID=2646250 RepID=UPI0025E8360F|nr:hypothetical protein [Saccharopolyspora sp.]